MLVIGAGSGATCGAALGHGALERLVCVEISPGVAEASRYFSDINRRYWEDPRCELVIDDGRNYLFRDDTRWDVITSEPSNPWIAGIGNLYTSEFYAGCTRRLAPGGLICQWIHLYEMDESVLKMILITFTRAFPHAAAFCSVENNDLLLIGSHEPISEDFGAIASRMGEPDVAADLKRIGITRLFTLLAAEVFERDGMRAWAGIGPVNSDDFPLVEYNAPKGFFQASRVELPTGYRLAGANSLLARYLGSRAATADELLETARYQTVAGGMTYMVSSSLADALEREPEHPGALELMVRLLTDRNKYEEAQGYLDRLTATGANEKLLLELEYPLATARAERRGSSLVTPPDFSRPASIKIRLAELEPEAAGFHLYGLGETYTRARDWTKAAAAFGDAFIEADKHPDSRLPEKPLLMHRIGESLLAAGELENAAAVYRLLLREYPDNPLGVAMLQLIGYRGLLNQPGEPDMEQVKELFGN
jgi:tetratricopeptide (TPR) repeat protein